MLSNTVKNLLDDAGHFTDDFQSMLERLLHMETYKSKQIVHAAGQTESNLYLIESGFARSYYYDHHGIEHTVRFWTAGDLMFSYEGYYKVPSFYYTEFTENSYAVALSYADFNDLQKSFPEASILIRHTLVKNRKHEHEREITLTLPAHERYERLLKRSPVIFQKSPAKLIASYLNMSRETLARLMGKH